nr:MAG TPA: hypothetical protein [Caudoviricetes sp.]
MFAICEYSGIYPPPTVLLSTHPKSAFLSARYTIVPLVPYLFNYSMASGRSQNGIYSSPIFSASVLFNS